MEMAGRMGDLQEIYVIIRGGTAVPVFNRRRYSKINSLCVFYPPKRRRKK